METQDAKTGALLGIDMPTTFTKFDPRAFLENDNLLLQPAKVANPAKEGSLATLAGLADGHAHIEGSGDQKPIAPSQGSEGPRVVDASEPDEYFCEECGAQASFGYGVSIKDRRRGRWFCGPHRPHQSVPNGWLASPDGEHSGN
jgi:hypothetical protein